MGRPQIAEFIGRDFVSGGSDSRAHSGVVAEAARDPWRAFQARSSPVEAPSDLFCQAIWNEWLCRTFHESEL